MQVYVEKPKDFHPAVEVAACYLHTGSKLLLLKRAKGSETGRWGVPAGKVETGESSKEAAERELLEETGIRLSGKDVGKLYIRKPHIDYIYHMFAIDCDWEHSVKLSDEHTDHLWVTEEAVIDLNLMDGALEAFNHYLEAR